MRMSRLMGIISSIGGDKMQMASGEITGSTSVLSISFSPGFVPDMVVVMLKGSAGKGQMHCIIASSVYGYRNFIAGRGTWSDSNTYDNMSNSTGNLTISIIGITISLGETVNIEISSGSDRGWFDLTSGYQWVAFKWTD